MATREIVKPLVDEWLSLDRDEVTRKEIQDLFDKGEYEELYSRLKSRMTFGTAGLRGRIAAGFLCMNELTVTQAAQGLYVYLAKTFPDLKTRGIAIGRDARNYSDIFAEITAATFLVHGVKVYMYSRITPTPYCPFATTHFNCCAGVMVTASHNPAPDNGYKVYWADGVQITEPHDAGIQQAIVENQKPWESTANRQAVLLRGRIDGLLIDPFTLGVEEAYLKAISRVHFRSDEANKNTKVQFGYSAMWGVGYEAAMKALKSFGFDVYKSFIPLGKEYLPDKKFGGCPKPNPEERFNMERASKLAEEAGCNVVIANDPDADRGTISEKRPDGSWKIFHGNELGLLLADWLFERWPVKHKKETGENVPPEKRTLINSTVSSKMLKAYAEANGANYIETLTGFKWIGRKAREEAAAGRVAFFGFEEAIGYMCGNPVLDKDGISAACCIAEMASELYDQGTTLWDHYLSLSAKYGYFRINNSGIEVRDANEVNKIFKAMRSNGKGGKFGDYVTDFGEYEVSAIRDLTLPGYDSEQPDHVPVLPVSSGQMLTYHFTNGMVFTARTSGTEPKIKWYIEYKGTSMEEAQAVVDKLAEIVKAKYLHP